MNTRKQTFDVSARGASLTAPPASAFPEYPASWYLFGRASDLGDGPVSKRMLGRQLVAFRTASGKCSVLAASCSHMGADLSCGKVIGESIQCPFHNWKYAANGVCNHIPGGERIPSFARQASYAAVERHGYLFLFNGPKALFPLPFFFDEEAENYVAGKIFSYVSDCNWYVNAAHGYDTQHFDAVHDRRLLAAPQIDCPAPFARRNRYRAEVLGRTRMDKWLRATAGKKVEITITNWGGTLVLITGDFDRAHSRFIIATRQLDDGKTLCEGIVFAPRAKNALGRAILQPIDLALRRFFTHGYLKDEASRLLGTRYSPGTMIEHDRDMIEYFNWVAGLPQSEEEMTMEFEANGDSRARVPTAELVSEGALS
ncbi:MAG TPA: Rieske 2Fe-2S domain-containing protein [Verrucomicrobiae bacterium]|nr:Rieske 2Fe-2S domain-containing protein [Verrucomicrobiae bacterium]